MSPVIKACLGILYAQKSQQVLMACRPEGKVLAGYWEFPGGKLEAGESAASALQRELREEINIEVELVAMHNLGKLEHEYAHGLAQLDLILIQSWGGEFKALENQQLCWYYLDPRSAAEAALNQQISPLLPTTAKVLDLVKKFIE